MSRLIGTPSTAEPLTLCCRHQAARYSDLEVRQKAFILADGIGLFHVIDHKSLPPAIHGTLPPSETSNVSSVCHASLQPAGGLIHVPSRFTLVELMVVVVILAVLIAILLPAARAMCA